jgi:phosphatidylinositol alpha-1,6-mannosyltransferase
VTTLLISEIFPPQNGGSGRWFWEIYRRLPRRDFFIAAGTDPRQDEFDQTHDLRLARLPLALPSWGLCSLPSLRGYWRALRELRRLVRAERVHAIHCGRCLPEGLMALALRVWYGIPYGCYVHGEEVNYATTSRELSWLARQVLARADFIIVNSRNTARLLQDEWHVAPGRIHLLHPGVDTQRFVPSPPDPLLRDRLGWGQRPVLLTVGRLQRRKGQDQMILALEAVRRTHPDVLYAILGDGEERGYLEELVARTNLHRHVQFLGELNDEDVIRCYQQCDLFVLANRQVGKDIEGFGMVLLEAQACGKPVLAGESGGTAETMRIPETGVVVPCEGPDLLAARVTELLADRQRLERMGEAARSWVVENFDWTPLSRQAAALFEVHLPRRASPAPQEAVHS